MKNKELARLAAEYRAAYLVHKKAREEADTARAHARITNNTEIRTENDEQVAHSALLAYIESEPS